MPVPRKRPKTRQNTEIRYEPGFFRADICSGHRKPSEPTVEGWAVSQQSRATVETGRDVVELDKGKGTMADSREVMNIRQASQYLGVSPDTLYKYVGEQKIPAFKLGNRWRFKKSKLDQWMEEKSCRWSRGRSGKRRRRGKPPGHSSENVPAASRRDKRWAHVWIGIEDDCRSGCGLLQHQGGRAEKEGRADRSGAPGAGAAGLRHRRGLDDRGLGHGIERDLKAVHRQPDQDQSGGHGGKRTLGDREKDLAALDERPGTGGDHREGSRAAHSLRSGAT